MTGLVLAAGVAAVVLVFQRDVEAALTLALHNRTYGYCLLVPFISLGWIWQERRRLAGRRAQPSPWGLAVVAAAVLAWWAGARFGIAEVRQMAVVAVLQGVVLAILGHRLYKTLGFPLLYLFLMVPTGTVLLGPLQTLTTWLAAALLWASGIPLSVDGYLIEVPQRPYLIEQGCSGLNYFLVAFCLSLLYAWRLYRGMTQRLLAVAVAMSASVLANGVRVYGIIALAEFTDRRIDLGPQNHLMHGWLLFSAIALALMAFGRRYSPLPPAGRSA